MNQASLAAVLAQALAGNAAGAVKPRKGKSTKAKGTKLTDAERSSFMAANDAECIKVFEKAGYKDVKPRENVLTYNKWIEKGRKVKQGESSHKVNKFSLFHISQTSDIDAGDAGMVRKTEPTVEAKSS